MEMNTHKFSVKPKATEPKMIHWHPLQDIISTSKNKSDNLGNFQSESN